MRLVAEMHDGRLTEALTYGFLLLGDFLKFTDVQQVDVKMMLIVSLSRRALQS